MASPGEGAAPALRVRELRKTYGNGTQALFYDDPRALFISSHQMPLYPDSGLPGERGAGNIINRALSAGDGPYIFRELWEGDLLPRLADAPVVASAAAHDCRTMTGDLLLDRLPGQDRAWVVGGGAGRAFALAPAIGARVAAHVQDATRPVEPRWAFARLTGNPA